MQLENFTDPAPLLAELEALGLEELHSSEHNIRMELSEHQFRTVMLQNPIAVGESSSEAQHHSCSSCAT